jgi:hypothetical protein
MERDGEWKRGEREMRRGWRVGEWERWEEQSSSKQAVEECERKKGQQKQRENETATLTFLTLFLSLLINKK